MGHSPRSPQKVFAAVFADVIHAGAMFYREGSGALALCYVACGRLNGFIELQINAWDVLGALAVVRAAGLPSNDFLAGDGLRKGGLLITGTPGVYAELTAIWERHKHGR